MRRTARAIRRAEPLRHDTFTAQFASVREQALAIAFKNLVHENPGLGTAHQFGQSALALLDWRSPQIRLWSAKRNIGTGLLV